MELNLTPIVFRLSCIIFVWKKSINRIYVILNIFLKYLDILTLLPVFISCIIINRKTSCISLINFSEVIYEVHRVKTQIINQCNPDFAFPFYTSYKDIFSTMLEIQSVGSLFIIHFFFICKYSYCKSTPLMIPVQLNMKWIQNF